MPALAPADLAAAASACKAAGNAAFREGRWGGAWGAGWGGCTHASRCDAQRRRGVAPSAARHQLLRLDPPLQPSDAASHYAAAATGAPGDPTPRANRSAALLRAGDALGAADDARAAVGLAPGWAKAHYRQCGGLEGWGRGRPVLPLISMHATCPIPVGWRRRWRPCWTMREQPRHMSGRRRWSRATQPWREWGVGVWWVV